MIITDNNTHPLSVRFREVWSMMPPSSELHLWKWSQRSPVTIKENVWVGEYARICKGVTIGKNAIIGANAVVTKDVPSGEIWGGVPARKIETVEEYYNKIKDVTVPTCNMPKDKKQAWLKENKPELFD